ncbi:MAG: elongation factor P maturation arginine rhamnosyltransferase EarP [Caldimonas sp.]
MRWHVFCKVVDHHGDVGVAWRLAADLAARGESVRFHLDDRRALDWMAPDGAAGVSVAGWSAAGDSGADVVVETFGCGLPSGYAASLPRAHPPVWIDIQYLSAEPYVERSHGLPSPQFEGPAAGLRRWFFYPGFTPRTGGLLRESDLAERQRRFETPAWLRSLRLGDEAAAHERVVSLFCYENDRLESLLDTLSGEPTLLLVAAGIAAEQVGAALGASGRRGGLRAVTLPLLTQRDYDHLLWSCDLNFVRGEDSFVRAQWAGAPFVWQAYRQTDGAHERKLEAFLDRHLDGAPTAAELSIRALFRAWNGLAPWPAGLPPPIAWRERCARWRSALAEQVDLTSQLLRFAAERR